MANQQSGEWLQLTEEDIQRAQQLERANSPLSGIIRITYEEAQAEVAYTPAAPATIRIEMADIADTRSVQTSQSEVEPATVPSPSSNVYTAAPMTISEESLVPAGIVYERDERIRRLEQLLFERLNQGRGLYVSARHRNYRLTWHEELAAVARGHSTDMIKRHYVEHISPEGQGPADRVNHAGIRYMRCGENVCVVYGENSHTDQAVDDIHNAFMNQPAGQANHRANIINRNWTHVGIGISYNPDGTLVATQNFISAPVDW